jgi:hypothetical protein
VERASADTGGEGSGEEQDEPDRGGDPKGPHAQQTEHEPGDPGAFEQPERHQPGPRHAHLGHVGEDPSGLHEIDGSGPDVESDRDGSDDHASGGHVIKPSRAPAPRPIHASITTLIDWGSCRVGPAALDPANRKCRRILRRWGSWWSCKKQKVPAY